MGKVPLAASHWCSRGFSIDLLHVRLPGEVSQELLVMTLKVRSWAAGLVHHSDQGVQYTSLSLGKRLEEAGIVPSMGGVGSAYNNALAESFIATLKSELLYRHSWPRRKSARTAPTERPGTGW